MKRATFDLGLTRRIAIVSNAIQTVDNETTSLISIVSNAFDATEIRHYETTLKYLKHATTIDAAPLLFFIWRMPIKMSFIQCFPQDSVLYYTLHAWNRRFLSF